MGREISSSFTCFPSLLASLAGLADELQKSLLELEVGVTVRMGRKFGGEELCDLLEMGSERMGGCSRWSPTDLGEG